MRLGIQIRDVRFLGKVVRFHNRGLGDIIRIQAAQDVARTFLHAYFPAGMAIGQARLVVDDDAVIDHGNALCRAFLDARAATDAAHFTHILDGLALVLGRTEDHDPGAAGDRFKNAIGANAHTGSATRALGRRNMHHVVFDPHWRRTDRL